MQTIIHLLSTATIIALLAGCSTTPQKPSSFFRFPALERFTATSSLIDYYQWLMQADAASLQEAREQARLKVDAGPQERLRHALLLSHDPDASTEDLESTIALLADALGNLDLNAQQEDFARLWHNMVELRLELRKTIALQAATIDSLRHQNAELTRQADSAESLREHNFELTQQAETIESLQERNAELTRQIEALTNIEQQLNQRELEEPGS